MTNYQRVLSMDIAGRVRRVLLAQNAITDDGIVHVWPREDRAVCIVDPLGIVNIDRLLSDRMLHHITAACQGRRVVFSNHRGAFIQVAYHPEPHVELTAKPLDWTQQSSPLHVPIGMTRRGPCWLSLAEMDAVLIGGARRMGKTRLLHAWIQALARGQKARLFLWDGKNGLEFGRYANLPGVTVANDLRDALAPILAEVQQREIVFRSLGVTSLAEHNARSNAPLPALVLVIDEAAFVPEEAEPVLVDLVARCGAYGIHPILATQRPDAQQLRGLLRANLSTRIALPVVSRIESQIVLGQSGAEKLAKQPGRLLLSWRAQLTEAQAFAIEMNDATSTPETMPITRLTEDEAKCVRTAAKDCGGFFKIKELVALTGLSRDFVLDLAKRWELIGWLTPVQTNDRGHRIGRRISATLCQIAGLPTEFGEFGT